MAHFIGVVQGSRGEATRLGGKPSGMRVNASGWDLGVTARMLHIDGKDRIYLYRTAGSNGHSSQHIATIIEGDPVLHLVKGQTVVQDGSTV